MTKIKIHTLRIQQGFTLVETLIYMGLLSIFVLIISDIFLSVLESKTESTGTASIEQDGRFMIARLTTDINRASSITSPAAMGATSSSLSLVINGATYSYAVVGGKLQITSPAGVDSLSGPGTTINSVSFQKIGDGVSSETVRISIDAASVAKRKKGAEQRVFSTTVGRR